MAQHVLDLLKERGFIAQMTFEDELYEQLTLMQTRKTEKVPLVFVGKDYWGGMFDWMRSAPLSYGYISPEDIDGLLVTDDVEKAVAAACAGIEC